MLGSRDGTSTLWLEFLGHQFNFRFAIRLVVTMLFRNYRLVGFEIWLYPVQIVRVGPALIDTAEAVEASLNDLRFA